MYNEHPSTKRIVFTLVAWCVGLLAVISLVLAISTALAPKTPSDKAPGASATPSAAVTASVVPTAAVPAVPTATAPAPTPTSTIPPTVAPGRTSTLPATTTRATPSTRQLTGKVVAIDAGHQLKGDSSLEPIGPGSSLKKPKVTSGTSGVSTHNAESAINLAVAMMLRDQLVARGAKVVMVRTTQNVNISNSKRAAIANDAHAGLFIRLHCDGNTDHSMTGISTLVPQANQWTAPILAQSKLAGGYVQSAVISATGAKNRGVVNRGDLSGFNWAKVPTVLVEMGFMSNAAEDTKLGTSAYQLKLAKGLASGIATYLGSR